ncbi:unnamed protein product [Miscanthus lutarioriparius]|uniref:Uncharacterized protein n=1 Tax=Miscanthus lutarioriparius TaxID=422564 RepID=A0A811MMF8_9POAL|nr:unnamed protein product [Miscanthus lutarioriparius]
MRRLPKSLLLACLSRPLRHRPPLPLLHSSPPLPPRPGPRLLPFSTQTLAPAPPPPPAPDAASTAEPAGLALLAAAELRESEGDHQEVLGLALKALAPLQASHGGWTFPVTRALRLAGAAAARAGSLSDALESLGAAAEIVDYLAPARREGVPKEVAAVGAAVYEQLARAKTAMGHRWDAVGDLQRALDLKLRCLEGGSVELGDAYRDVAEAYAGVLDFDKALPLCSKALGIAEGQFGEDSAEVAKLRRLLMAIYTGLGRHTEALEQIELARMVYERLGLNVELSQAEIDGANIRILLGRSEEAMGDIKRVMQRADKESEERALAYVTMAKILISEERVSDSKRCLEIALGIIDAKDSIDPGRFAEAYAEISMLYESMTQFEMPLSALDMSLSLMKKTLAILESAKEMHHIEGSISARMGWLLLHTQKADESVPYLERAVDKLKNCFGPRHFGLGFAYRNLGQAYLEMYQHQSAVKFYRLAIDIIEATFGPTHEDSIDTKQSLANAYGLMGSYKLAIDFQEQVIDAYSRCGSGAFEDLREANRLLEQLKKKAQGLPHAVFPAYSLPVLPENND